MLRKNGFIRLLITSLLAACAAQTDEGLPEWGGFHGDWGKGDIIGDVDTGNPEDRFRGQAEFVSAAPYWDFLPYRTLAENAERRGTGADTKRAVEESDVFRHDAERRLVYALNSFRGLQIIDVAHAESPRLLGRADVGGSPVEMFQRGDFAYVLVGSVETDTGYGSLLEIFDVSDPTAPLETARFSIVGNVGGSHLLSTDDGSSAVVYVVSNIYEAVAGSEAEFTEQTYVMAIDVTDPTHPAEVEKISFPGAGWGSHVTPEAIFVAQNDWSTQKTLVRYVDISDLGGAIRLRGSIEVEGTLAWGEKGELQLDHHEGTLRVASQVRSENATFIRVATISTADPDQLQPVGQLDVAHGESLLAARFDGNRAYLFHMVQVDPLEVIDLENPADLKSLGLLRIEGSVNHIEVRGDKLITLGVDQARKLAVILFDVSSPTTPVELGRAVAGEGWAWTSANFDIKSFRIVDELGLVLLPVASSSWDADAGYTYREWLQLFNFDLAQGTVEARGEIDGVSGLRRAFPVGGTRIVTLSDRQLQVVDVENAWKPQHLAALELARDVQDFVTAQGFGIMVVGMGDGSTPKAELRVVPLSDPDNAAPLATLSLDAPAGRIYPLPGNFLAHVGTDPQSGATLLTVVRAADPLRLEAVANLKLPEAGYNRFSRSVYWQPAPVQDLVQVGDALVLFSWPNQDEAPGAKLRIISLKKPRKPSLKKTIDLGTENVVDMKAEGRKLYVTTYEPIVDEDAGAPEVGPEPPAPADAEVDADAPASELLPGSTMPTWRRGSGLAKYRLHIIDLGNPDKPKVGKSISVPGTFVGTTKLTDSSGAWTVVFTMDSLWHGAPETEGRQVIAAFDAMALTSNRKQVRLLDVYGLPEGAGPVASRGESAYFSSARWWWGPVPLTVEGNEPAQPLFQLHKLSMSRPDTIEESAVVDLGKGYGYLADVRGDFAFVSTGWSHVAVYAANEPELRAIGRFPTLGWWNGRAVVLDGRAYLPSGLYGLHVIDLW